MTEASWCDYFRAMTFNRNTAYHEAGHVIGDCHFGHGIHAGHVAPSGRTEIVDRKGRVNKQLTGLCEAVVCFNWHLLAPGLDIATLPLSLSEGAPDPRPGIIESGFRVMISTLAGPMAEARRRHMSLTVAMFTVGAGDWAHAEAVAKFIAPKDPRGALDLAERVARAFLREPGIWDQVEAVVAVLMRDGIIEGDHPLLQGIEGWRPLPEVLVAPARRLTRKSRRVIAGESGGLTAST